MSRKTFWIMQVVLCAIQFHFDWISGKTAVLSPFFGGMYLFGHWICCGGIWDAIKNAKSDCAQ